jgi:hypothetical protein
MADKERHELFVRVEAHDGFDHFHAYGRWALRFAKIEPRGDGWEELVTEDDSEKIWRRKEAEAGSWYLARSAPKTEE